MNEAKTDQLLQLYELFDTVCQGLHYLAEHPDHIQVRTDTGAGLKALRTCLQDEETASDILLKWFALVEERLIGALPLSEVSACTQQGALLLTEWLSGELAQELVSEEYVSHTVAERLFAFVNRAPRQCQAFYQLAVGLCLRSAVSMPKESYQCMLRLLEEQPHLLSGAQGANPEYVYRASKQRIFERCPVCGGEGTPYYSAFSYRMVNFDYPHLPVKLWMRCSSCENLYTYQYPEEYLTQAPIRR